jgi:hypothetical protein
MKFFNKALSVAILVGSVIVLSGCPGSDGATAPEKIQLEKLSKQWTMVTPNGALFDGTDDRSGAFTGFKLTISGTFNKDTPEGPYNFAVTGSMQEPSPWPASSTWSFNNIEKGSDAGTVLRSDGVPMSYSIDSTGKLVLTFTCVTCDYPGARTGTVNDEWQFTFQ